MTLGLLVFPPLIIGWVLLDKRAQQDPVVTAIVHLTGKPADVRWNGPMRQYDGYRSTHRRRLCVASAGKTYVVHINKRRSNRRDWARTWQVEAIGLGTC